MLSLSVVLVLTSAAATLMGNPSPCYAGFTEGEATVKLYENAGNVAMLIAGATGEDKRLKNHL